MRGEKKRLVARTAALGLGLAILAIFMLLPSAGATPERTATAAVAPDLSTMPRVKSYLRSLGLEPRGFVIQRGLKNYAGPNCPGAGWTCTTASKVVQLSSAGNDNGENRFVCKPQSARDPSTNEATNFCFIVQGPNNATNSATCDLADSQPDGKIMQTCFARQEGRKNSFIAKQLAVMGDDDTDQDVFQTISVRQKSGTGGNTLETSQVANLSDNGNSPAASVFQDVHQLTCGNQIATGSGPNVAKSGQTQSLDAEKHGAALGSINQNTDASEAAICVGPAVEPAGFEPIPEIVPPHDPFDCAIDTLNSQAKENANACTRIQQVSGSGRNTIRLNQLDLLEAEVHATAGTVNVTQGNLAQFTTGTDATLDQKSSGLSQIFDGGLTSYDADITTGGVATVFLEQNDTGPRCCAGGHQFGNPGNDFLIGQIMSLKAKVDGELVDPNLGSGFVSQFGIVYADCETSGMPTSNGGCVVGQLATNNVDTDTRQCGPDPSCHTFIRCNAFGGYGGSSFAIGIQQVVTGNCQSDDELTFAVRKRR